MALRYRRVSQTQHRVLFLVELPSGPRGLEYMLAEAKTILIE